jgi:hypothetical protein
MADHSTVQKTIRRIAANRGFSDEDTVRKYLKDKISYRRAIEQNLRFDCAHFAGAIHAIFTNQLDREIVIASDAIWNLKYRKKTKTFGTGPQDQWELFNLCILDDKLANDIREYSHCVSQWVIGPAKYSQDSIFYGFTEEGLKEMQLVEWTEFLITSVKNDVQKYCAHISASGDLSVAAQQGLAQCLWFVFSASPWAISDGEKLVPIAKNPAKLPSATAEDCKLIPQPAVNGRIEMLEWLPSRMSEMSLPKKEPETPKERARRLALLKNVMFSK